MRTNKVMLAGALAAALACSACGYTVNTVKLKDGVELDFIEHRTILSTATVPVLRDGKGNVVLGTTVPGTSIAGATLDGAATIVGGGVGLYIGRQLPKIGGATVNLPTETPAPPEP